MSRGRVQLKRDGTRWRTGGEVKGKLANGVGSQYSSHYLGTWCIQHYYRWWRTPRLPAVDWTDAPRRFKWTRPFSRKTNSGFCACAITFQTQSNSVNTTLQVRTATVFVILMQFISGVFFLSNLRCISHNHVFSLSATCWYYWWQSICENTLPSALWPLLLCISLWMMNWQEIKGKRREPNPPHDFAWRTGSPFRTLVNLLAPEFYI